MTCPDAPPIARPLPDVTTARLELRRFVPDDLDALASVFAKPPVWEFPYGRGLSRSETRTFLEGQMREWAGCGFGLWCAIERRSADTIGFVGLSVPRFLPEILPAVEVGWRIDPDAWGCGYATEGAGAALDAAFETLGLAEVCSVPQVGNARSVRVAERLGMRRDRVVTIPANDRRGAIDGVVYRTTPAEWRAAATGSAD